MKKKVLTFIVALTLIINSLSFIVVATGLENSAAIDVFLESGGDRTFCGAFATFNEASTYINAQPEVNAHFIIELNTDAHNTHVHTADNTYTSSSPSLLYTGENKGSRTITVTAESQSTVLYLDGHNGIQVGVEDKDSNDVDYTQNININIENITLTHNLTGSFLQYFAHGTVNIKNCIINVPDHAENDPARNYAIINTMTASNKSAELNITDTDINVLRPSSQNAYSVVRTGNYKNNIDVNIDGCNITTTVPMHCIYMENSTAVAISMSDTSFSTVTNGSNVYAIRAYSAASTVNLTLDSCMFYKNNVIETNIDTALSTSTIDSVTFNGFSSIGGYNTFPDLVITEVHLESINVEDAAGPYNTTKPWSTMDWWPAAEHPTERGSLSGDFLRYIEIYNASDEYIDLGNYKIVVDTNAFVAGSEINEIPIVANTTVGSAENPQNIRLAPGKTAVIYLYNSNDNALDCTIESFKGYYSWRYNGADTSAEMNTAPLAPTARDKHLVVDMTDTLVIAVDDIGTSPSDTKLGDFVNDSIYYGIVRNELEASESKDLWTSWALFEHYYQTYIDNTTKKETSGNQANQSTFNFLYGLDASGDIREGRRLNEVRPTYNCNPGVLQEIQKLNFTQSSNAPEIAITEINNVTKIEGSDSGKMDGDYDFFEVANIASYDINIYDYCVFQRYDITHLEGDDDATQTYKDFSIHYFNRVSYIIPGEYGDIQAYSARTGQIGETEQMADYIGDGRIVRISNPNRYADDKKTEINGVLKPGETAIIWMYDESCYIRGLNRADFAKFFEEYTGVKPSESNIFALAGWRNQVSELGNYSLGVSNTQCSIFGIGRLDSFDRENEPASVTYGTGYPSATDKANKTNGVTIQLNSYPELKKESFAITNENYKASGFPIHKCESVVFMFSSMITAGGSNECNLGVNKAYQYASAYVNGMALRFAGFLETVSPDSLINENGELVDANGNVTNTPVKSKVDVDTWVATPNELLDTQKALVSSFSRLSYSITYHANNNTDTTSMQYVYAGTTVTLPASIDGFTKDGYYISKWSTTADGTGDSIYEIGSSYTIPDTVEGGQIHLYAIWTQGSPTPTYILSIPPTLEIGASTTGVLDLSIDIKHFSDGDTLTLYIDSKNTPKYTLAPNDPNITTSLGYKITNEDDSSKYVQPGSAADRPIAFYTSNGDAEVYNVTLIAQLLDDPIYAGIYTDTLTFEVATSNQNAVAG